LEKINYKKYPILFVDDETENLDIFAINFRDLFTVYTAESGPEALKILEKEFVALVVSDQRMPGMTGMEFLQEVHSRFPEMVLVLVTAYSDLDILADGLNAGLLYAYLLKPWEIKDFHMVLTRGIEHYYLVSERDRLHQEQIETLKKMARANKLSALGTLAAGIAHEIRNPLVSIQTFLEMVPQKLKALPLSDPDEIDMEFWEHFRTISYNEIQRIRSLISELVNLAAPAPPTFSEIRLHEIVQPMVDLTMKEAGKRGVLLRSREEEGLPPVRMDAQKVKQVVLNLLLNAMQAMPDGGEIEIITRVAHRSKKGRAVQLVVKDSGGGISEENHERLFDPFFTTRQPGEGVGLGLTICHQIMEEHGGDIEIKSRPGEGTEVILSFALAGKEQD
jgi:two-component system sensor histidine kinase HydH